MKKAIIFGLLVFFLPTAGFTQITPEPTQPCLPCAATIKIWDPSYTDDFGNYTDNDGYPDPGEIIGITVTGYSHDWCCITNGNPSINISTDYQYVEYIGKSDPGYVWGTYFYYIKPDAPCIGTADFHIQGKVDGDGPDASDYQLLSVSIGVDDDGVGGFICDTKYDSSTPPPSPVILESENADMVFGTSSQSGYIESCDNGDWIAFSNVDFGPGIYYKTLTARLAATGNTQTGIIELRLEDPDGVLIGFLHVFGTGSVLTFTDQIVLINAFSGIHDLYLVFKYGQDICRLDSVTLGLEPGPEITPGSTPTPDPTEPEITLESTPTPGPTDTGTTGIPGDANSDGIVDIIDALLTAQHYVGLEPQGIDLSVMDVNEDNSIDIIDALMIAQYYVGLISELPAQTLFPDPIVPIGEYVEWQKQIGGSRLDRAVTIKGTSDGGYIIAGYSTSIDIEGCTYYGVGGTVYIIKLNSEGNIEWQKMYGGDGVDSIFGLQETNDGGYIMAGRSYSSIIGDCINNGGSDCYLIKIDATGNLDWQKMFGGSGNDCAYSIRVTSNGGYIVTGYSNSTDIAGCTHHGDLDVYLIKLDTNGNIEWQRMIGGNYYDNANVVDLTNDGGYIMAGSSSSKDIEGCINNGGGDYYIVKYDAEGNPEWQKMFGGNRDDIAKVLYSTDDQGYIIAGTSSSTDIVGCTNHGTSDYFLMKYDVEWVSEWNDMIGGSNNETLRSLLLTAENTLILVGESSSTNMEGIINHGSSDCFVVKYKQF